MEIKSKLAEKVKELLSRNPNWEKMANELVNHGLGYMPPKEHDYLVREKMISCDGEVDMILCEYPKLKVGDKIIDFDGNLNLLQQEQRQQKKGYIYYTPKKYSEYLERKKYGWKQEEQESMADLIQQEENKFEDIVSMIT